MRRLSITTRKLFKIFYCNEFKTIKLTDEKREYQKISKMQNKKKKTNKYNLQMQINNWNG